MMLLHYYRTWTQILCRNFLCMIFCPSCLPFYHFSQIIYSLVESFCCSFLFLLSIIGSGSSEVHSRLWSVSCVSGAELSISVHFVCTSLVVSVSKQQMSAKQKMNGKEQHHFLSHSKAFVINLCICALLY